MRATSTPHLPIEDAIVNRFRKVVDLDPIRGVEVGDSAGDTEDLVVGASG